MLTPKQQAFCEYYIACHNATQSEILAKHIKKNRTDNDIGNAMEKENSIRSYIVAK